MKRSDEVIEKFKGGRNCSQAVFAAYAEECGLPIETALKIACGFGGGLGRLGYTCGAVTGAIMVIGLKACDAAPTDPITKTRVYGLVRSFMEEFEARHETTLCRELLGCDIGTPEGHEKAKALGLFDTECPVYIRDAVEILEEMF
jgi:C_GCAxxG_C_C family probable redox protein